MSALTEQEIRPVQFMARQRIGINAELMAYFITSIEAV